MTLDQYNEAVKQIFVEQQTIAAETIQQALAGAANPMNPQFIALMNRQWVLIQRMMKLNGEMLLGIGNS
jgi:glucokinase